MDEIISKSAEKHVLEDDVFVFFFSPGVDAQLSAFFWAPGILNVLILIYIYTYIHVYVYIYIHIYI